MLHGSLTCRAYCLACLHCAPGGLQIRAMLLSASACCAGDVYRRDSIDQSHYPVFHQMEGENFHVASSLLWLLVAHMAGCSKIKRVHAAIDQVMEFCSSAGVQAIRMGGSGTGRYCLHGDRA